MIKDVREKTVDTE